ncbi:MAG: hypothetical protein Q9170_007157, partial [Blastenia crenularia]
YEFNVGGNHVMRRRQDNWINATHILKVADYDKPARTRILEREVQKGVHEKVQGGYGKYQGTWVPLQEGRLLAERNGVLGKLLPIFDFTPGPISPPQAPKHQTAASNKGPKVPKQAQAKRHMPPPSQISEDQYEGISTQLNDDESIDHSEIGSETFVGEEDMMYRQQHGSRKRRRVQEPDFMEQQHTFYADSLLDYFMLSDSDRFYRLEPPPPPESFIVNRPIDEQGHTALHWGAAMGDIDTIRMFIDRGARIDATNLRGETPLIRAVLFTNNYEKETTLKLVDLLQNTIMDRDRYGATVLHHVAMTTKSSSRKKSARHYLNVLLTKLADMFNPRDFAKFLDYRDNNGDTAIHIVARHNARKCVRSLLGRGVNTDIPNNNNETAAEILQRSNTYRVDDFAIPSSSPVQPSSNHINGNSQDLIRSSKTLSFPNSSQYESQSAQSFSNSFGPMVNDKALQVNLAMEDELQQMDASYAEANRMIENTAAERNAVRQKTYELSMEDKADNDEVRRLQEQSAALEKANESFLEQDQHRILHQEVRAREQNLPLEKLNDGADVDDTLSSKLKAAHELAAQQIRRRELSRQVVQAQAEAGMSENGEAYKKLIALSMSVPLSEVASLVPEVLEELEMSKTEGATTAMDGVMGGKMGMVVA